MGLKWIGTGDDFHNIGGLAKFEWNKPGLLYNSANSGLAIQ